MKMILCLYVLLAQSSWAITPVNNCVVIPKKGAEDYEKYHQLVNIVEGKQPNVDSVVDSGDIYPVEQITKDFNVIVNLLNAQTIDKGCNQYKQTPLIIAVEKGNFSQVEKILKAGSNPNIPDADGKTSLHYASIANNAEIADLLIKKGANPFIYDTFNKTAKDYAVEKGASKILSMIQTLLTQNND